MSRLLQIQELLQSTSALLAQTESAVASDPHSFSLFLNCSSLQTRFAELEVDFLQEAAHASVDVCRYRIFADKQTPNALAATSSVADFQRAVSLLHDAMRQKQPKQRSTVSLEALKESSFDIGYVYPGSVGFALKLPSTLPVVRDSTMDDTLQALFELVTSKSQETVAAASRRYGPAVIRSLYKWVSNHVEYWMGLDIQWMRGTDLRSKLFMQQSELQEFRKIVEVTSEEVIDTLEVVGKFVGYDVAKETIHMEVPESDDINATFADTYDRATKEPEFRSMCWAKFRTSTKVHLSIEKEDKRYYLLELKAKS